MKKEKIPNGALRLVQTGEGCNAFAEGDEGEVKKLQMTVYSGGIIKGHWFWGDLAVDLEGLKFSKDKYPVLEEHDRDKRIAFTGKPIIENGALRLDPKTSVFLDNEHSLAFQKESSQGFPFQASLFAKPSTVERIGEGDKAEVNGMTMKGPASIWRKAEFQEASICVFGWDKQTESKAFSKDETTEIEYEELGKKGGEENTKTKTSENKLSKEVSDEMPKTVEELTKAYPDLVQKLTDDLTVTFDAKKADLVAEHQKEVEKLSKDNETKEERLVGLEKKDLARDMKDLKTEADVLVATKLAASDIPDTFFDKIKKLISHDKFVNDGKLDREAFEKAVDEEIKFFEDAGATTEVMGMGSTSKSTADPAKLAEDKLDKDDDEAVDSLVEMAEGKKEK